MCWGVTSGLAFEKFSGSLKVLGKKDIIINSKVIIVISMRVSLYEW